MTPRPDKFPDWARNDVVDPDSGVNNVVEPSEAKKNLGWGPQGEHPPRQYLNWLFRKIYTWLRYLDENQGQIISKTGTVTCKLTVASGIWNSVAPGSTATRVDSNTALQWDAEYVQIGKVIHLITPGWGANGINSVDTTMDLSFVNPPVDWDWANYGNQGPFLAYNGGEIVSCIMGIAALPFTKFNVRPQWNATQGDENDMIQSGVFKSGPSWSGLTAGVITLRNDPVAVP